MRAVVLREPGPPEHLGLEQDWPRPTLRPGCAIVRVEAEGVCHRDVVERRGGFPFMKRPVVPGHEFAGTIVELADDVDGFAVGQRVVNLHRAPCGSCWACTAGNETRCQRALEVFGLSVDGGYAEYVLARAGCLVPVPDGLASAHACFLNCTAAVALRALRTIGAVQPGETVAITGASGGVGLHAIQIAKALGARVLAITTSAGKADVLGDSGADDVVVADGRDFHKVVKRRTAGVGVPVVLDCVGEPTLNASLRSLESGGRLIVVGNVTSARVEINAGFVILGELTIRGSAGSNRADLEQVLRWTEAGVVRPALAETMPLSAAADAHRRLEAKGVVGRLVLTP
ncbi:MAG TPA: zinc-binding dehydrogenase [Nannocystaceae bacterium]|nr:zinc-binding dehydrogenase [Nannocystaceae bacterium]